MSRELQEGLWALSAVSRGTVAGSEVGRVATIHSWRHCPMAAVGDYHLVA